MARAVPSEPVASSPALRRGLTLAALTGLGFAAASSWVHYQLLHDSTYSSICDVNATFSCTEAYTSRFGSFGGVSVALLGVIFFSAVLWLIAVCQRSRTARQNLAGYIFVLSTVGLAAVLYLGYASFFVLRTVCLLCVGTYAAVIALFVLSSTAKTPSVSDLTRRVGRDVQTLVRTPAALVPLISLAVAAITAATLFSPATAATVAASNAPATETSPPLFVSDEARRELDQFLSAAPRETVPGTAGSGAAVVIVKFNDYQCPPCGVTFREYKPVLARLQQQHPGQIAMITKDFPLDPECNSLGGGHAAGCEAAAAVRLARAQGRADAMEDWLFANQSSLTPDSVKRGAASVGGVAAFESTYPSTLELVRADIAQGLQLRVNGTPTFFLNGIRLPILRPEYFQAAVEWELRRVRSQTAQRSSQP